MYSCYDLIENFAEFLGKCYIYICKSFKELSQTVIIFLNMYEKTTTILKTTVFKTFCSFYKFISSEYLLKTLIISKELIYWRLLFVRRKYIEYWEYEFQTINPNVGFVLIGI